MKLLISLILATGSTSASASSDLDPVKLVPKDIKENKCSDDCEDTCGNLKASQCYQPGWVYCDNAICDPDVVTEDGPISYTKNGELVPFVKCQCWQPSNSDYSILPEPSTGAGCVLGLDDYGGEAMCDAIKDGALISTYGPFGEQRGAPSKEFQVEFALCDAKTPWSWCWGAPCVKDEESPTGITCHCPYLYSDSDVPQSISLAGQSACSGDPCSTSKVSNSMPAGSSPNELKGNDACYVASDLPLTDCKDYPKKKPCVNNGCVWDREVPNAPVCKKPPEPLAASGLQDVSEPAKKNSAPDIKAKVAPMLMLILWFMN